MLELMCLEEVETDSTADKLITIVAMSEQKTINSVLPGTPSDDPHQRPGCSTPPAAAETKPRALKSRFSNQIKRNLTKQVGPTAYSAQYLIILEFLLLLLLLLLQDSDLFFKDGQRQIDMVCMTQSNLPLFNFKFQTVCTMISTLLYQ